MVMTFTWVHATYIFVSKHVCLHKEETIESVVNQMHFMVLSIKVYLRSQGNGGVGY